MCTQCLCTSTYFDAAGADENVLKEASENWKLEVIKNLESRTSMQRDPICSWKGCCLNFSLYFQYIFNIYIYTYIIYIHIFPMISIHFIPDLYPLAHSKISKWPADQETTAWPHLEDLWSMWSGAWSSGEWNWIRPRRDHSVTWCHLWHFSGYWRV